MLEPIGNTFYMHYRLMWAKPSVALFANPPQRNNDWTIPSMLGLIRLNRLTRYNASQRSLDGHI